MIRISNGKDTILHLDPSFELPKFELKDFIGKEVSEYADSIQNLQTSISIAKSAYTKFQKGMYGSSDSLLPIYLKKSQAERALNGEK